MTKPIQEMSSWNLSGHSRTHADEEDDAWQKTRHIGGPATQMVGDQEEYLAASAREVGRHLGNGQWELFVVCDPGEAMHQQFQHLHPEFIAIHDIGTTSSRRLLAGLAAASGSSIHRLVIRRQGHGVALATLEFVEIPTSGPHPLRVYTTEADADTTSRRELARMLLAYSRLGVVMVGDLPPHALEPALQPLRDAIVAGPWPNRHLLLLPLSSANAVTAHAAQIARGTHVSIRTTPQVTRPADAWNFVVGSWNKVREQAEADGTELPTLTTPGGGAATPAAASTQPPPASTPSVISALASATATPVTAAPVTAPPPPAANPVGSSTLTFTSAFAGAAAVSGAPVAPARSAAPAPSPGFIASATPPLPDPSRQGTPTQSPLATYARRVAEIKGMVSCCLFETATQKPVAHAGTRPGPASLASQGAALLAAINSAGKLMGMGDTPPDAAITLGSHHLLLRPLPNHPELALHAVLDRSVANLTLVRLQLQRLDETLDART
jgi:hypothetical protein